MYTSIAAQNGSPDQNTSWSTALLIAALLFLAFFVVIYFILTKINDQNNATRHALGLIVIFLSISAMMAVALIAIYNDKSETAENIFNQILPVVAAWVGTILAYFFGRENFEAATKKYGEVIDKINPNRLAAHVSIEQIMIVYESIFFETDTSKDAQDTISILETYRKSRFPIFKGSNKDRIAHLLYRQDMISFMDANKGTKKTIQELIDAKITKKYITIDKSLSLKDVKTKMEENQVLDGFITNNGMEDGRVEGYVTMKLIERFLTTENIKSNS